MLVSDYIKSYPKPQILAKNVQKPKVSVLLAIHSNIYQLIRNTIQSVLNQTLIGIEIIIVDCSGENAVGDLIKEVIRDRANVTYLQTQNKDCNIAVPYYMAFQYASAEFITMLADSCIWEEDYIEKIRNFMLENDLMVAYGEITSSINLRSNNIHISCGGKDSNIQDLACHNILSDGSLVFRRSVLCNTGFLCPHNFIQDFCLWDFYCRLSKRYLIGSSGVIAGRGFPPNFFIDNGSSYAKNWLAHEFVGLISNEDLLLSDYAAFDMDMLPGNSSKFLAEAVAGVPNHGRNIRRVLVIVPLIVYASATLYEERLHLDKCNVRLIYNNAPLSELALADMVIVIRELFHIDRWLDAARELNIPIYYFTDDNFMVLRSEYPDDALFKDYKINTVREKLMNFTGVLFSTKELLGYFEENKLHSNLMLFEPIMGKWFYERTHDNENYITISYMGGLSRASSVTKLILPALQKLSEKIIVRFICPSFINAEKYQSDRLEIFSVNSTNSLDHIIMDYARNNIDIQLHCAIDTENNRYKTINALMNAVQAGACLIASDTWPYNDIPGYKDLYALSQNNEEAWVNALWMLASNPAERKRLFNNSKSYCMERFSGEAIAQELTVSLKRQTWITESTAKERLFMLGDKAILPSASLNMDYLLRYSLQENFKQKEISKDVPPTIWFQAQLSNLTLGAAVPYIAFKIKMKNSFSYFAVGICCAHYQCVGTAVLNIYSDAGRGFLLRNVFFNLTDINDSRLLEFEFQSIDCSQGVQLFVEILFYTNEPCVSVYEYECNLFKKAMRKLLPILKRPIFYIAK